MRKLWFITFFLLSYPLVAFGQAPTVGIFLDSTGTNCNLVDDTPGILKAYVVVHSPVGIRAVQFSAPKPACLEATFISDIQVFPLMIGNSQTGISIPFGYTHNSPVHVLTILYSSSGTTPPCCYYPVLPHPDAGIVGVVDYKDDLITGVGLNHTINGDMSCFCGINPPPEIPSNPNPYDGSNNTQVVAQLSWESSDPEVDPLTYDIYFGTDSIPPLVVSDHPENYYSPDILEFGTLYFWKIVVKDDHLNEVEGPRWSFNTVTSSTSRLVAGSVLNYCGYITSDTVVIDVFLEQTPLPIDTGGIDISFDSSTLTYISCGPGDLTSGWPLLSGSDQGSYIQIIGASATPIPSWSNGSFARLFFLSNCCGADTASSAILCPQNPVADLRALFPVCGEHRCEVFLADGDVNDDGSVTPADALCAFYGYLNYPDSPGQECGPPGWDVRSDADCSGDITPSDALCIFKSWLDGSCSLCQEYPGGSSSSLNPDPAELSIRDIQVEESNITVIISLTTTSLVDALGFEVQYPADQLEFVSMSRSALSARFDQFGETLVKPGRLRLGGYILDPVNAPTGADLIELRFRRRMSRLAGTLTIDRYVDDLIGATSVTLDLTETDNKSPVYDQYRLFQNRPNPFNPWTEIQYEIPDGVSSIPVRLTIFNIEGKPVRTLVHTHQGTGAYRVRWYGRNQAGETVSSGVYLSILQAGDKTLGRKMVLLK